MADPTALEKILGISFNNAQLLEQALVHSSFVNENPTQAPRSNERPEFLGDAVLGLIIAEELYWSIPDASEGELTNLRAALVRGSTLARIARSIGIGDHLRMGKGEEANGGRDKTTNLAGALEAVIAAVFLDQGFAAARECTLRLFRTELHRAINQGIEINYKSRLQKFIQEKGGELPVYYVIRTEGPAHNRSFTVEVRSGNAILSNGTGKSKKLAETEAARYALDKLLSQEQPQST
ncbi:MAG: ribonuclease III [Dehalococcoidales bacterium]|nr:ribonuclease III [Dehalococcoidales bacterium]